MCQQALFLLGGTGTTIYGTNKQCRQHPLATVVAVCKAYMREQEHKEVHYPAEAGYVPPTEHIGYPTAPAAAALAPVEFDHSRQTERQIEPSAQLMHSMPGLPPTYLPAAHQPTPQPAPQYVRPVTVEDTGGQYEQMRDQSDHEEESAFAKFLKKCCKKTAKAVGKAVEHAAEEQARQQAAGLGVHVSHSGGKGLTLAKSKH